MIAPTNASIEVLWIQTIQPFFPTITIVNGGEFGDENRPKPDKPYLIVSITNGPTFLGEDQFREGTNMDEVSIQNIVRYTMSFQSIGSTSDTIISTIATSLYSLYYRLDGTANLALELSKIGIAIHSRTEILSLEENLNTGFERRKTMEVEFSLVYELATGEDGVTIDSSSYSGQIDDRIIPEKQVKP